MSHYSKLLPEHKIKVDAFLSILATQVQLSTKTNIFSNQPNHIENMKTLQQIETQAILVMADQLKAAQKQLEELKVENESLKETAQLWKDEAERWRWIGRGGN